MHSISLGFIIPPLSSHGVTIKDGAVRQSIDSDFALVPKRAEEPIPKRQ
jgi:hypothetical protein